MSHLVTAWRSCRAARRISEASGRNPRRSRWHPACCIDLIVRPAAAILLCLAACGDNSAATQADAGRTRLGEAGFTDVAVFAGTAPALDAESAHGVAA